MEVEDDDSSRYTVHFMAIFSENPRATPVLFLHGWPGSVVEFLPLLLHLKSQFDANPVGFGYHIIVPSLIGFGWSSPPPNTKDFRFEDNARLLSKLMSNLGFSKTGYVVQGGDIGSPIAASLAAQDLARKLVHVNLFVMSPPEGFDEKHMNDYQFSDEELTGLQRGKNFWADGVAYALIQATRPSTVGIAIASSPYPGKSGLPFIYFNELDSKLTLNDLVSATGSTFYDQAAGRAVPVSAAKAVLPALCLGYVVPFILAVLPSQDSSIGLCASELCQLSPACVGGLTYAFSRLLQQCEKPSEWDIYELRDAVLLQVAYSFSFFLAATSHIILSVHGLQRLHLTPICFFTTQSHVEFSISYLTIVFWCLYNVYELRRLGFVSTRQALFAGVAVVVGQVFVGSGATPVYRPESLSCFKTPLDREKLYVTVRRQGLNGILSKKPLTRLITISCEASEKVSNCYVEA
ncbi:hypothetical protein NM208_g6704 [Fusarium decemcellulare]|uniref:Uncharacterized protein n=1 Tax=Fusarium decemcellulare TaxID=57161 RepID=A0ACC1SCB0_9HYPO|nr:hypothetical protein NM208_g6704 [Fusarium decemcellulare]